jgi:ABC-type transport system involved in Fe-S cluster assembly fused permease/ATPase subunit
LADFSETSGQWINVVIAHRLATIKNADRIIVVADQGIAEQGKHEELMAVSNADVASSKMRIGGFFRNIRAMDKRCF